MSIPNPFNEPDAMSDAQLDELLDLATPKLDPVRQKALRRTVAQTLKTNRPFRWWFPFQGKHSVSSNSSFRIGLLVAACCLLVAVGAIWNAFSGISGTTVNTAGRSVPEAIVKPLLSGSELAKAFPPIISKRVGAKSKRIASKKTGFKPTGKDASPSLWRLVSADLLASHRVQICNLAADLKSEMEVKLLQVAGSETGLKTADQLAVQLEGALQELDLIQSANRAVSRRSGRSRKSAKTKELQKRKHELEAIVAARQELEDYLVGAIERLPVESATSAYRLLCRCGGQSSLPAIMRYRNVASTQSDAALAIGRLADSRTLSRVVLETRDATIQSQLMSGLLCRHDQASLDLFLELTAKHDLYAAAQKSGGLAHCVPTEILMQRLRSNRVSIARAAAITMSGLNDPGITEYLMQLASRPETHRSAVMALTARTDVPAIRFVELAKNDVRWSATVINEKKKWSRILAVN